MTKISMKKVDREEFRELNKELRELSEHLDKANELYWTVWAKVIKLIPKEEEPNDRPF